MTSLEELFLTCTDKSILTQEVQNDSLKIRECIKIVLQAKNPQSWRAAWTLKESISSGDAIIREHMESLINLTIKDDDSLQREVLNLIAGSSLTDDQEGKLFENSLRIWRNVKKSSSVRITAFKTVLKIVNKYPELTSELSIYLTDEYSQSLSPGIYKTYKNLITNLI